MARFDSLARFIALFQQLMAHREGIGLEELIRDTGVTRRTLHRDLALLESLGFQIERLGDPDAPHRRRYRLGRNPMLPFYLEEEEIMAIALVSGFSSAFPDSQLESRLDSAVDRLRKALPRERRLQLRRMEEVITFLVRNVAGDAIKSRHLWDLLTAIANRRLVECSYYSQAARALRRYRLEAYRLILYEGAFYVIVRDVVGQRQLRLHLGRFRELKLLDEFFKPDPQYSGDTLLKQGFGISWDKQPFTVVVKIAADHAYLVEERTVHPSQKLESHADGSLTFSMRVCGIPEIKRWVLGFGPAARVLEPDWLVAELRDETKALAAQYR